MTSQIDGSAGRTMSSNSNRSNSSPTSDGRVLGQTFATNKVDFKSFTVKTVNAPGFGHHRQLKEWVAEIANLTQPDAVYWADGSQEEYDRICAQMVSGGTLIRLNHSAGRRAFRISIGPVRRFPLPNLRHSRELIAKRGRPRFRRTAIGSRHSATVCLLHLRSSKSCLPCVFTASFRYFVPG